MKYIRCWIIPAIIVIASLILSCRLQDDVSEDLVVLEFISPVNGGSWAATDTVPIEVQFLRDSISSIYVEFSTDSGASYNYITAGKESEIIKTYSHNYYKWIPADNSITDSSQVLLRAYNYINHSQSVTIPVPLTIYP